MAEHGRVTVFKLDDPLGALQDVSPYFRSASGLPGKSDRPNTTTFGNNAHMRSVLGLRDGGPIQLGGLLRRVAGTSIHGRQVRVLTDEFSFHSDFTSASLSRTVDLPDSTTFGETWRRRQVIGIKDGNCSFAGQFNPASGKSDERFRTYLAGTTAPLLSIAPEGFGVGNLVDMLQAQQGEYTIGSELESIVPVNGAFVAHDEVELGFSLHDLTAETGVVNGTTVDQTTVSTTSGWVAHLHVTAITGSGCTIKIQDSADGAIWADLAGATFASVTAATKERLSSTTGTVRRYVRYIISAMTASSITFVVAFSRRGETNATGGTYAHFARLYGLAAPSSFEYGPEGSISGDRKFSGECRLSSLETSYGLEDLITFTATLMVDGAVAEGTF